MLTLGARGLFKIVSTIRFTKWENSENWRGQGSVGRARHSQ